MSKKILYMNMVDESRVHNGEYDTKGKGYVHEDYYLDTIKPDEYKHLYLDRVIEPKELDDVLSVLLTFMMQNEADRIHIDLDAREREFTPAKEMTMEEVEAALGYKVKLVNKIG